MSHPDIPQEPTLHPGSAGNQSDEMVPPEPMPKLKGFKKFTKDNAKGKENVEGSEDRRKIPAS